MSPTFVAIDFETADTRPESACALGVVRVEEGKPVDRFETVLRCPLDHHNPLSDAAAAAEIVLRAMATGTEIVPRRRGRRSKRKTPRR